MNLTSLQRKTLREAMQRNILTMDELDLHIAQDMIETSLAEVGVSTVALPSACQALIVWAEKKRRLAQLLDGLAASNEFPDAAAAALALKQTMVANGAAVGSPGPHTNRLLSARLFLNRSGFCRLLRDFANKRHADRVILVQGEEKSGKTYSKYIIASAAEQMGATFVPVDLNEDAIGGRTDAQSLTRRLLMRLDGPAPRSPYDDLGQDANKAIYYTDALLARLGRLQDPVWLIIDNVNGLRVDQTARDLVWRICDAVETGECDNLWLILLGVAETDAVMSQQVFVSDRALLPQQADVHEFLTWFLSGKGKSLAENELIAHVDEVMAHARHLAAATDGPSRSDAWTDLHGAIRRKCEAL